MAENKQLAFFVLLFLLSSSLAVNGQSGNACIPTGQNCNSDGSGRCCGNAACQPEFVCVTEPCPAPWVCI